MKIIVTGGAGFIGSHVADAYVKAGHKVVVIDNLSVGSMSNVPKRAKFYKADVRDANAMNRIFLKERPEAVSHHAAFISVTESVKKPEETFENNVMGTLNVVLAFARHGTGKKKFLFSSTGGAIYGNPKKLPADESTLPQPLSPYALSKYIDEQMIMYYCDAYRVPYLIFRYANVYGPRQHAQGGAGIFPIFIHQMRRGAIPVIFGDGKKTRDYVYVEDVAHANLLGLRHGVREIVNIASNHETSDYYIFKALATAVGFTKKPRYTPRRKGEVKRISMSFSKAKRLLGWTPKTPLKEGIQKTVKAF
jgi:UDP-glucose 4-epimerase